MAHLLAEDLEDYAEPADRAIGGDLHPPLRRTWIVGWREVRLLAVAYIVMTSAFAVAGWVAFGDDRRWWLVDVDERVTRWFVERRTDPLDTATLIGALTRPPPRGAVRTRRRCPRPCSIARWR